MPTITNSSDPEGILGQLGDFLGSNSGLLDSLLGTGLSAAGINELMSQYDDTSSMIRGDINQLIEDAKTQGTFTPFGVTSASGTTRMGDNGLEFNVDPSLAGATGSSLGLATDAFGRARGALGDLDLNRESREQGIYDRLRALRAPEEARAQSALDRKLMAQGRSGVRTNEFGGTPEQLALSKAIEESKSQSAVNAMNLTDQQINADLGRVAGLSNLGMSGFSGFFAPQSQLLNQFQTSNQLANILANNQANMAGLSADLGLGGLEAIVGMDQIRGGLLGDLYTGLASAASGTQGAKSGLISNILGLFD